MKRFIFVFYILITAAVSVHPEVFRFKFTQGQKQRVECTITGYYFINGIFHSEFIQEYKTIDTVNKLENNIAAINEINYYFESRSSDQYRQISQTVNTNFSKDQRGIMIVKNTEVFPTFRNIPLFPEQDIKEGYKWIESGFEVQDFFRDNRITSYPVDVYYEFAGYENIDNKKCALINFEFTVDMINNGKNSIDPRISRILGSAKTSMYFDNVSGNKVKENYENHYFIVINDNSEIRVDEIMNEGARIWYPVELMQKDRIMDELNREMKRKKLDDTTIQKDDKGIKISLENIQFLPESSALMDSEKARLDKIADILKKYRDRGLMIVGHTTDKGTEEGRRLLSADRAKVVMEYILKKNALDPSKSTYIGKGGTSPIADNNTEEGMKKNRRVEIYILEE